jgi:sugar transferase (PEP-CTERM/EpsH1 system associated)
VRILFLSHRLPYPPNKGDKIRSFHEILHLSKRHQIHLLCFEDPEETRRSEEKLREYCSAVEVFPLNRHAARLRSLVGVVGSDSLTLRYFHSSALASRVEALAEGSEFDVLMACGSAMAQYAERAGDKPKLLDMVDVDSVKWEQYSRFAPWPKRLLWRLEAERLSRYESALPGTFRRIVLTTSSEAETLSSTMRGSEPLVIRNGIDLDNTIEARFKSAGTPTLVFTGQMDYFANVDGVVYFAEEIMPILRPRFPGLRFLIVGRSPSRQVLRLEKLPGVTVTGEVSDVRPYLGQAWVFVAPLRIAQGVQNKVLEAMAMGIPAVVSQPVMRGLSDGGFRDGQDLLVASNAKETGLCIERLLRDEMLRASLAASARSRLAESYSWAANMETLEHHLEELVRGSAPASFTSGSETSALQTV